MKKKLKEAAIKVDVSGLESSDFDTLARMFQLAGQAEAQAGVNPGFSELPKMEPFDFDGVGGDETQPIMNPGSALEPSVPGDDGMDALGAAVDDLSGTVTDFGAEEESDDLSLDMDGEPSLELDVEDDVDMDDGFDMDRMSSLAGISESLEADEDGAAEEEEEDSDELADDEEGAAASLDEALLPDLSLEEDALSADSDRRDFGDDHHVVDSKEHGPFRSHSAAVHDAMRLTNGTEYEHFVVIPGKDGFYWRRNLQESTDRDFGDDHHKVGSPEHGPFRTHREAVHDGMEKTDGDAYEHFAVIRGKDGFYWRENTQPVHEEEGRDFGDDHHKVGSPEHGPFRTHDEAVHDGMEKTDGDKYEHFAVIRAKDGFYWRENTQPVNEEEGRDFGDDHHKVDSPEHGPFRTHDEAVHDGMVQTNGDEFEHFAVIRGKDGFYWRENTQPVHEEEGRDFGDDHHVEDSKEHGPFRTEREAVHDAMRVTNGTEFEHFAIIPGQDGYYWRRNSQDEDLDEELDNEPDPSMVDMAGIENSRHAFKRTPGTALGDNPLRENDYSVEGNPSTEDEMEEMFEEEDVDDIFESINSRYNAFLKGL